MEFPAAMSILAFISGAALAAIQIRRIIKGELGPWGIKGFRDASRINIDKFDKCMLIIAGLSFAGVLILIIQSV